MNVPAQINQQMQLPAHLQQFASRQLSQTVAANIGTAAPPFISIQGGRLTLVDGAGNEQPVPTYDPQIGVYLDCVIFDLNDHLSKVYYASAFDPSAGAFAPPDCWSDNGQAPSRQAAKPQAPLCGNCQWNAWGSAVSKVSGKGVKACHDQQKIAVYVPGFPIFFLLRIPPNSLKNFRMYAEQFQGQNFDMDVMVTRISFEPNGVGTLRFSPTNWIDAVAAAAIADARAKNATDSLVGRTDQPRDPNMPLQIEQPAAQQGFQAQPQQNTAPPAGAFDATSAPGQPGALPQGFGAPSQPAPQQPGGYPPGVQQHPGFGAPQQAAPFVPNAAPAAPATTAPQAPMQPSPAATSPSEAPRGRGRRRTTANQAPAGAPQGQPQQAPFPHAGQQAPQGQPAPQGFAQPQAFQPAPAPQAPAAPAQQPSFGIQQGAAPDPGLAAALTTAFGQQQGR